METSANKETFKLLKISDDSKSFSDLDLPEITNQRKRKVRRKTRPRLVSTSSNPHHLHPDVTTASTKQCSALVIWIIVFFTCCWLLTLSYMIAVIHSENLRLEVQIKKLTVTSQNLPETLQQWHETTKQLEQNQTIIYAKIADLQHFIENLSGNLTQFKTKVDEMKNFSKDEKFIADFGAKVEAVTGDVERIKELIAEVKKDETTIKTDVTQLQNNFTNLSITPATNSSKSNYLDDMKALHNDILEKFNSVKFNLTLINDTLSQKTNNLNEEVLTHQQKIVELFDKTANITSHVASIENDWPKYKDKITDFDTVHSKYTVDIAELKNTTIYMKSSLDEVRSTCNKYYSEMVQNFNKNGKAQPKEKPAAELLPVGDIANEKSSATGDDVAIANRTVTEKHFYPPNMR